MKKHKIDTGKFIIVLSFIFTFTIFFICLCNLLTGNINKENFVIPYSVHLLILIHAVFSVLFFYLIFRQNVVMQFVIYQIESLIAIIAGYPVLGIFIFHFSSFFFYLFYYESKKGKKIFSVLFIIQIIVLCSYFFNSWEKAVIYLYSTVFMYFIFLYFTQLLKKKFSCFIPSNVNNNLKLSHLKSGNKLSLTDFGLSERQANFVYDFMYENLSYSQLSKKYFVSLSTVKKEFTDVFKLLGVKKIEELHILLLQYNVEK